jgi:hypothetical protein
MAHQVASASRNGYSDLHHFCAKFDEVRATTTQDQKLKKQADDGIGVVDLDSEQVCSSKQACKTTHMFAM